VRRHKRSRHELPVVSIVGYTNAGRSTLLNVLTQSSVLVEDKLFATLDPTSRRLRFPREHEVIITDTVGFIRDLPKDLVNAFRATLEELDDASLLLHVVDASDPSRLAQVEAVEKILEGLGLLDRPRLLVWNKADRLEPGAAAELVRGRGGVAVSAQQRWGLMELLVEAEATLFAEGDYAHAEALRDLDGPPSAPVAAE
jgi:GTPase